MKTKQRAEISRAVLALLLGFSLAVVIGAAIQFVLFYAPGFWQPTDTDVNLRTGVDFVEDLDLDNA